MGIFGYLKGMIALAILAFIGYMNIWAFNFKRGHRRETR